MLAEFLLVWLGFRVQGLGFQFPGLGFGLGFAELSGVSTNMLLVGHVCCRDVFLSSFVVPASHCHRTAWGP